MDEHTDTELTGIHEVRWIQMPGTGGPDTDDRWVWRCSCGEFSRYDFDTGSGAACAAGYHLGEQAARIPQAEAKRLRGLLAKLEWAASNNHDWAPQCPACDQYPKQGHDEACWLAAEIGRTPAT